MSKGSYSGENAQEDVSFGQLLELFAQSRWTLNKTTRDIGEDFHAKVTESGHKTGLGFDVQLKSVKSFRAHNRRNGEIGYKFKVQNILEWGRSNVPVVLIVWNVTQRWGYWVTAQMATRDLDKRNPSWRENKYVEVKFKEIHNLKGGDLTYLRLQIILESQHSIGDWFLKSTAIEFDSSPEGQMHHAQFEEARAAGNSVNVPFKFVKLSEPDRRVLGPLLNWSWQVTVHAGPPKGPFPYKFEVQTSENACSALDYIELWRVRPGTEFVTYSNGWDEGFQYVARPASPLNITFVLAKDGQFELKFSHFQTRPTAEEIVKVLPFVDGLAAGCRLRISELREGFVSDWFDCDAGSGMVVPDNFRWLVQGLNLIEERVEQKIFVPNWDLGPLDMESFFIGTAAVSTGLYITSETKVETDVILSDFRQNREFVEEIEKVGGNVNIVHKAPSYEISILGNEIDLGPCTIRHSGVVITSRREIEDAVADLSLEKMTLTWSHYVMCVTFDRFCVG